MGLLRRVQRILRDRRFALLHQVEAKFEMARSSHTEVHPKVGLAKKCDLRPGEACACRATHFDTPLLLQLALVSFSFFACSLHDRIRPF